MNFTRQSIPDVVLIDPHVHGDNRGYFMETFKQDIFEEVVGYKLNLSKIMNQNQVKVFYVDYIINSHHLLKLNW